MIKKSLPNTDAEAFLAQLAESTFLSLWSYPSVYRDQGKGKEVCDLLVVFDRHVIVFSDKDCDYPEHSDEAVNWNRWFKRAVEKSADQIFGAERWLRAHPDRLFVDESCTQSFPVPLPNADEMIIHRVVVAHNVSEPCHRIAGGTGTLFIASELVGDGHYAEVGAAPGSPMFTVGQIAPDKGYVHVLEENALTTLMLTLDTISDFVAYLTAKEALLTSTKPVVADGEEELLATYLGQIDENGEHTFQRPTQPSHYVAGSWANFQASREYQSRMEADRVSYVWDRLIEQFATHALDGTQYFTTGSAFETSERILRFMAAENRTLRRALGSSVLEVITTPLQPEQKFLRVFKPVDFNSPHYVFLSLAPPSWLTYGEYRMFRREMLKAACSIVRLEDDSAHDIVGLAFQPSTGQGGSEDALYFNARHWNDDLASQARRDQKALQILTNPRQFKLGVQEYPEASAMVPKVGRNDPCPCGSGTKYKRCCLRR